MHGRGGSCGEARTVAPRFDGLRGNVDGQDARQLTNPPDLGNGFLLPQMIPYGS